MTQQTKTHAYLTKMKVTLAAGGLAATLIGAGLLGNQAREMVVNNVDNTPTIVVPADSTTVEELTIPNFNLEAVPTVAAPTFRSAPVAFGRSSG